MIWVPTRGWPFVGTIERLNEEKVTYCFERGGISVADVRNKIAWKFMDTDEEVLVMVDDDVVPPHGFYSKLMDGIYRYGYDIVSGVVLVAKALDIHRPNVYVRDGTTWVPAPIPTDGAGIIAAQAVGTGCIAVHRRVLKKVKHPFNFKLDSQGIVVVGEDLNFCQRASSQGFKIAARYDVFCEHYDDVYANGVAQAYLKLIEEAVNDRAREDTPAGR